MKFRSGSEEKVYKFLKIKRLKLNMNLINIVMNGLKIKLIVLTSYYLMVLI